MSASDRGSVKTAMKPKKFRLLIIILGAILIVAGYGYRYFVDTQNLAETYAPTLPVLKLGLVLYFGLLIIEFSLALHLTETVSEIQESNERERTDIERMLKKQTEEFKQYAAESLSEQLARQTANFHQVLQWSNVYLQAEQNDPDNMRRSILSDAMKKLKDLSEGRFELRGEDAYYDWLSSRFTSPSLKKVRAVSFRRMTNYETSAREKAFLRQNVDAAARGVVIERIFIVSPDEFLNGQEADEARELLRQQFCLSNPRCLIVWADRVRRDLQRLEGGGFSVYDDDCIFVDHTFLRSPMSATSEEISNSAIVYRRPSHEFDDFLALFGRLKTTAEVDGMSGADAITSYSSFCDELLKRFQRMTPQPDEASFSSLVAKLDNERSK
jgi:hypothetical protein